MAGKHCCLIEGDHDTTSGEALCRGWCHKRGNKARLMRPKRGKAALRAEVQGQGAEVHRGRNVFKRCARTETWCSYVRSLRKGQCSIGSQLRRSGKENVTFRLKKGWYFSGACSIQPSIEDVNEALVVVQPHVHLSEDWCTGPNANKAVVDTSPWKLAVARAQRAAELYALHAPPRGKPQPEVKKMHRSCQNPHVGRPQRSRICFTMKSSLCRPRKRFTESEETFRLEQSHRPTHEPTWEQIQIKIKEAELNKARQLRQDGLSKFSQLRDFDRLRHGIFREIGCTACELRNAGFPMKRIREEGFTATQLIDESDFTTSQVLNAGYGIRQLLVAGLGAAELHTQFSPRELRGAGLSANELCKASLTARPLRKAGFTARELCNAGFTATQLLEAGFNIMNLFEAGFTVAHLREAAMQFREAGSAAKDLLASGFTVAELHDAGFTSIHLQTAGCTIMELSSLFEVLTIHAVAPGSDGRVDVSCFSMGGSCAATSSINISAGLWELLEVIEKDLGRSVIFLRPDGHIVTPGDAMQPVNKLLSG